MICKVCGVDKDNSEFYLKDKKTCRLSTTCKPCDLDRKKIYHKINKEKDNERSAFYYKENKEKISEQHKEYRSKNSKKISKSRKGYRDKNKEKISIQQKASYSKNKHKYTKSKKEWYNKSKKITKYRVMANIRARFHNAMKRAIKTKSYIFEDLSGCKIDKFKKHIEDQFEPGMTWENYGRYGWHVDHIKPCASFDLNKNSEIKKCFHYTNLQPLWWKDNLKKGAKIQ